MGGKTRRGEEHPAIARRYQEPGKIRHIGVSTHVRPYAAELVRQGVLDVLIMRYNAAHRGAEQEIFPQLAVSKPGVVSYTATRWGRLLRRPREWPPEGRRASARDCYRFVLSNPNVDVEEMAFMSRWGEAVRATSRWFL